MSLTFKIQISHPAVEDAREQVAFIRDEHQSPEAARRWLSGLHAAIKDLSESPNRFPVIPEAEELGFPYRSFAYHSHRIVYAVDESARLVTIHRVYHGARRSLRKHDLP